MLCVLQQTVEAAHAEIYGNLFEKIVKDAIASAVDGKAMRKMFITYVKRSRSAKGNGESAKVGPNPTMSYISIIIIEHDKKKNPQQFRTETEFNGNAKNNTAHTRRHAARLSTILSLLPRVKKVIIADKTWCS
ncbi:hypothetical protein KIW84_034617 [Lathyrus oleraceus]|uniref:Uncharacterized protein n=1 Tax=Pisum sativum TaxID=3888 RepID=A0A9D4XZW1_PEA|nr:hypothetical protein KIW84_034617 [Pisum sativum]